MEVPLRDSLAECLRVVSVMIQFSAVIHQLVVEKQYSYYCTCHTYAILTDYHLSRLATTSTIHLLTLQPFNHLFDQCIHFHQVIIGLASFKKKTVAATALVVGEGPRFRRQEGGVGGDGGDVSIQAVKEIQVYILVVGSYPFGVMVFGLLLL